MISFVLLLNFLLTCLSTIVILKCFKKPKTPQVTETTTTQQYNQTKQSRKCRTETEDRRSSDENLSRDEKHGKERHGKHDTQTTRTNEQVKERHYESKTKKEDDRKTLLNEKKIENSKKKEIKIEQKDQIGDYEKMTDDKLADNSSDDSKEKDKEKIKEIEKVDNKQSKIEDSNITNVQEDPISVYPSPMVWNTTKGEQILTITNKTKTTLAIKMRCSNNDIYLMVPVYFQIKGEQACTVKVTRSEAPPSPDRISLVSAEIASELTTLREIQAFFKDYHGSTNETNLNLVPGGK